MSRNPEVVVFDYGSQFNLLITRRLREQGVFSELVPPPSHFSQSDYPETRAVILSGGPQSVYDEASPKLPEGLLESGIPVLGICYGMQLLCQSLGGEVTRSPVREYGPATLTRVNGHPLTAGLETGQVLWMSHGDKVSKLPTGSKALAATNDCDAIFCHDEKPLYGLQFHPEVSHTEGGERLLRNFLELAGCRFDWTAAHFIDEALRDIREKVGKAKVCCALSGGVDSTVAATLVHRAIGDQLTCLFVDNGLLRYQESERVLQLMKEAKVQVQRVDAEAIFLENLESVSDPEKKRKVIGHTFIEVFEQALAGQDVTFLVQGTLYPDVVESGAGQAATIKTHHNVGGLPEDMKLKLLEPLRELFKDEVRKVGRELGLPESVVSRQPFPGPGMAVRVLGQVDKTRLDMARAADHIATSEIEKAYPVEQRPWQYYAALLPVRSVGVMGDGRQYGETVAVRAVRSHDAMTADVFPLDWALLERIAVRIVNEVEGVNRVVYDITPKPPATIEWE
ncbi:MAG: glutamine-hydrolyzing GMP synthase [Vulcanimicrobiota bacterium]